MRKIILVIFVFTCLVKNNASAQYWSPLGTGIGIPFGAGVVFSVAMYNGELYAGGYFNSAGGVAANNIAKWNGTNWSPVGQGLVYRDPAGCMVSCLTIYNGELYATGQFDTAGGIAAKNIAKWNGTSWSAVDSTALGSATTMAVFNGELYVAGYFPNVGGIEALISKWDGTNWSVVGTGMNLTINRFNSLLVYNGALYAAGDSASEGGVPVFYDIVKWDGANWSALNSFPDGPVNCMSVYNGELYAAGYFTTAGGVLANQIAKWNGTNWSAVGTGINLAFDGSFHSAVLSLEVYNGALYAAGYFNNADSVITRNIAKWDGTGWAGLGLGTEYWVSDLKADSSALYVGGWFNQVNGNIVAHKIAKWEDPCSAPPPPPNVINGNNSVCTGSTQTYSVSLENGAPGYTWTLPSGWAGSSTTNTITATAGITGGTISVIANNNCGSSSEQTLVVTVNTFPLQPGAINGNNFVCQGNTQTYSISPVTGATSYTWNIPTGWAGSSTTNTITATVGVNGGPVSVTANNNCGSSNAQALSVTVNSAPLQPGPITGDNSVCQGNTQTYSINAVTGATSYTWTLPQGWPGSSTSNSLITTVGTSSGLISVSANNSCGNSINKTLAVSVDSVPARPGMIIGNIFVNTGQSQTYSINPVNGTARYTWSVSGGGIITTGQNSNNITVNWQMAGTYMLSVNAGNNCGVSADQTVSIKVTDAVGVDPFELKLMPNPSSGEFYLKAKGVQGKLINIEVFNMSGQVVHRIAKMHGANNYSQLIDLKKMADGQYLVKILIDSEVYVRKIIKIE